MLFPNPKRTKAKGIGIPIEADPKNDMKKLIESIHPMFSDDDAQIASAFLPLSMKSLTAGTA